ncbi:MAG: lipopolysaccharide biosynthesis protein [Candidatus Hodarchaeota archaeon]
MSQKPSDLDDQWQIINFSTVVLIATALSLVKGLISIKFFTNILSTEELSYFAIGIVAINFCQQAISLYLPWTLPRILARFERDSESEEKYDYITSIVVLYLFLGFLLFGGYTLGARLLGGGTGIVSKIAPIAILTGMLWSISFTYLGLSTYRQSPKNYLAIQNGIDYVPLILSVLIVLVFQRTGHTALQGLFIGYIIVTIGFVIHYVYREKIGHANINHIKLALNYSSPFALTSVLVILTPTMLIFLVQAIFETTDVATFWVGWSVSTIGLLFNAIPNVVFSPRLFRLYETKGLLDALDFTQNFLKLYLFLAIPLFALIAFYAQPIVAILASRKYLNSASLFIILLAGQIIYGVWNFTGMGIPISYRVWELPKSYAIGLIGGLFTALALADYGPIGIAFGFLTCNLIFIIISYSVTKSIVRTEFVSKKTYLLLLLGVLIFFPVLLLTRFIFVTSILRQLIWFTILALILTAIFTRANIRYMTIHSEEVRSLFKHAGAEQLLDTVYINSVLSYLEKIERRNNFSKNNKRRTLASEKLQE